MNRIGRSRVCSGPCGLRKALYGFARGQQLCHPCRSQKEAARQRQPHVLASINNRARWRYREDPAFAALLKARARAYYWRMKRAEELAA